MPWTENRITEYLSDCTLCPRNCHVDRSAGQRGFCGQTSVVTAARAALHYWEEPVICGEAGSGAVFFSGCSLRCVFCQNHTISNSEFGKPVTIKALSDSFLRLQSLGAVNINLVTGSHFIPQICMALELAKNQGLHLPVVFNSSGYESVASLKLLEGLVDIWLPDLKYFSSELSARYSKAPDYFDVASRAIAEMVRQAGKPLFDEASGLMKRGVIVRHLCLPGQSKDSKKVLRYLHSTFGNDIYVSIMNQYTPLPHAAEYQELNRSLTEEEYEKILTFAQLIGIEQGFCQEGGTDKDSFIPAFDGEGLL
ncbi:MAG: radical SAM protein [Acetatifactor sp.]